MTTCTKCAAQIASKIADYVIKHTGGLCWKCFDSVALAKHLAKQTPAQKKRIRDNQIAIAQITDAEIHLHCQFNGLPRISKK